VEALDEAGLPYGPVGKGFKKLPAGKKREAMMKRADKLRAQAMQDDGDGGRGSARGKMGEINAALTNPRLREETDLFDYILEHLVTEGYADTNEAALAIMANMSEEWRQSIVEELEQLDEISDRRVQRVVNARNRRFDRSVDSGAPNKEFYQARRSNKLAARRNERTGSNVKVDPDLAR
jgi:hypothetical protein